MQPLLEKTAAMNAEVERLEQRREQQERGHATQVRSLEAQVRLLMAQRAEAAEREGAGVGAKLKQQSEAVARLEVIKIDA